MLSSRSTPKKMKYLAKRVSLAHVQAGEVKTRLEPVPQDKTKIRPPAAHKPCHNKGRCSALQQPRSGCCTWVVSCSTLR